jgi:hypothetical protein
VSVSVAVQQIVRRASRDEASVVVNEPHFDAPPDALGSDSRISSNGAAEKSSITSDVLPA